MANLIKMDLRRLFRSKSFLISLGILAALNIIYLIIVPVFAKVFQPSKEYWVNLPELIFSPFTFPILMVVVLISVINFAAADMANGFIKNLAGQVPKRSYIIFSKFIVIGIHNIIFLLAGVASNMIGGFASTLFGAKIDMGDGVLILQAFVTLLIKWLLLMGISAILLFVVTGIRSKNFASILAVFLGTGALGLVYLGLNSALDNVFGSGNVHIDEGAPDQLVNTVNVASGASVVNALIVGLVCCVLFMALTIKIFNKRDIK